MLWEEALQGVSRMVHFAVGALRAATDTAERDRARAGAALSLPLFSQKPAALARSTGLGLGPNFRHFLRPRAYPGDGPEGAKMGLFIQHCICQRYW